MNLIEEFHTDHQKVVSALLELRQSIAAKDIARVRSILNAAEELVGPHFKFEELYLYPTLKQFLGESTVQRLLNEHDGIFRSVGRIAQLAEKDTWSEADVEAAQANLELIYEHPVTCDGLGLWIERLPEEEQRHLLEKMQKVRRERTGLFEYQRERQSA